MRARQSRLLILLALLMLWLIPAAAQASPYDTAATTVAEKLVQAFPKVWGVIASVGQDGRLILDLTREHGIYPGLEMEVFREGETFKHPVTGEVMGRMEKTVATLQVVEVRDRFSVGQLLDRDATVKAGDGVRVTSARILVGLAKMPSSGEGEEAAARALARDVGVELNKTGRFEVLDERLLRSTLMKAKVPDETPLRDPAALKVLRQELRVAALALIRVSSNGGGGRVVDVQLISTRTAAPVTVVSAEIPVANTAPTAAAVQPEKPSPPRAAPAPTATAPPAPDTPTPAWLGPPGQRRPDQFLAAPYAGIPSARLVLGPEFDEEIRGIAVADLSGDGRKEVAVASQDRISVFAIDGKAFRQIWSSKGQSWEKYNNVLALDAADINGDGVAELFVTSFFGGEPTSYVLEFQKDKEEWVQTWTNVGLFFRVLPDDRGQPILYAQEAGSGKAFADAIYTYGWRNGKYERGAALKSLPPNTYIYNFGLGDVKNDGSRQVLQITPQQRLRLYSGGKLRSEPTDRFGGSGVTFDFTPKLTANVLASMASPSDVEVDRRTVHPHLLVTDVSGDGKRELVAVQNMASTGYLLKNAVLYDKSKIVALQWSGVGFQIVWETQELEGYIPDFYFGDLGDEGGRVLIFALVQPQKLGLAAGRSGVLMYRLVPGEAQVRQTP